MNRKVIIAGGSGFIGRALSLELAEQGYTVIVLSRTPEQVEFDRNPGGIMAAYWNLNNPESWLRHASDAYAVVNLAGDNIASTLRWTEEKKENILWSRLDAGKAVASTLKLAQPKPQVLIQASAIGYYGNRKDEKLIEDSSAGEGYLAEVAKSWEKCADRVREQGIRCVTVRTGIVLGKGGFLKRVLLPFKFWMGGHPGSGKQWFSWIHMADEVSAIRYLIEHETLEGVFNLTSPNPLPARDFFRALGRVTGQPSWLHPPALMLRLLMGELADELILSGQRVLPDRLVCAGYNFKYPDIYAALQSIIEE